MEKTERKEAKLNASGDNLSTRTHTVYIRAENPD